MYSIARFILKIIGWNISGSLPEGVKKCVMIIAPHTSHWDFIIGRLAFWYLKLDVKFMIKKEFFVFPIGYVVRWLGGLPVDRSKGTNSVTQTLELLERYDSIVVAITPEGTRKLNPNWKKGFYFIAQKANVPLALGFINYRDKKGGIGPTLNLSGDFNKDLQIIEDYYRKAGAARFPENFNLSN
jgi:1-acyl-sn-glycerol-3-phosphate acyltransferase